MNCPRSRPAGQRGAALVVALLVFALSTALIVAMKGEFDRFYRRGANIFLAEQAHAYLRGAEDLASIALQADFDQDKQREKPRDDLLEIWAQPTTPYALDDGGWLLGSLEDLQGRFNLNSLEQSAGEGPGVPRYTPAQKQFIRLLQALEEPLVSEQEAILIADSIGDWLDRDGEPSANGVEDDYYYGLTPAYRSANGPMASVSELMAVANMSPEIYRALAPWVTVWPVAAAPMNIHTAPPILLRTINVNESLSPLSEADGQTLADYRESTGFADIDDLLSNPVFGTEPEKLSEIKPLLGESSAYFLLEAEVEVADRQVRLYSVLQRLERRVGAVFRTSGGL